MKIIEEGMHYNLAGEERRQRKVWKILLILEPVGNGASPGGKMEYGKRGWSAQESFWEISKIGSVGKV